MSRILFCLALCLHAQTEKVRNPHTTPEDVAAGAKTFRSHCAPCHGYAAEGGRGPNLAAGVFYHGSSDADLLRTISNGIDGTEMPGNFYSPDRVWQIVAYIRSLSADAAPKPPGHAAAGEKLFATKGCAGCHRVAGEGGRFGPDLTSIGRERSLEYLKRSILEPNADVPERYRVLSAAGKDSKSYSGFLMNEDTYTLQIIDFQGRLHSLPIADLSQYRIEKTSKMPSYEGKLQSKEVDDLVAYLSSLRPKAVVVSAEESQP